MKRRFALRDQLENCYGKENVIYGRWCKLDISNEFTVQEAGVTLPCKNYLVKRMSDEICVPNLFTLEYVVSGSGYVETESETVHVKAGDTYLLRWQEEFLYYADPDEPFEKLWINFSGKIIHGLLTFYSMIKTVNVVHVDSSSHFTAIHDVLRHIEKVGYSETHLQVLRRVLNIFDEMSSGDMQDQSRLQKLAIRIKDEIDKTPYYNVSVSHLAEISHYCNRHLERTFKNCYGITIKQYIQNCKIEQAKLMIRYSADSLAEIGTLLGFCDYNHFSSVFRSLVGESPAQYAKCNRALHGDGTI